MTGQKVSMSRPEILHIDAVAAIPSDVSFSSNARVSFTSKAGNSMTARERVTPYFQALLKANAAMSHRSTG